MYVCQLSIWSHRTIFSLVLILNCVLFLSTSSIFFLEISFCCYFSLFIKQTPTVKIPGSLFYLLYENVLFLHRGFSIHENAWLCLTIHIHQSSTVTCWDIHWNCNAFPLQHQYHTQIDEFLERVQVQMVKCIIEKVRLS